MYTSEEKKNVNVKMIKIALVVAEIQPF